MYQELLVVADEHHNQVVLEGKYHLFCCVVLVDVGGVPAGSPRRWPKCVIAVTLRLRFRYAEDR